MSVPNNKDTSPPSHQGAAPAPCPMPPAAEGLPHALSPMPHAAEGLPHAPSPTPHATEGHPLSSEPASASPLSFIRASGAPLISFCLIAYNQERFIREAVEGAFAQTYSPLEIILSDDCSTDRTYEIMEEMASLYSGPHKIILNRNKQNMGIGGHIKQAILLTHGEIILLGAGDDISLPNRAKVASEVFLNNPRIMAFFSATVYLTDQDVKLDTGFTLGKESIKISLDELSRHSGGIGPGASYVYRRKCFFWPSEYPDILMNEDRILPYRAALLGEVHYIPDQLIEYRQSSTGVSRSLPKHEINAGSKIEHIENLVNTVANAKKELLIDARSAKKVSSLLMRSYYHSKLILKLQSFPTFARRPATMLLYHTFHYKNVFRSVRRKLFS